MSKLKLEAADEKNLTENQLAPMAEDAQSPPVPSSTSAFEPIFSKDRGVIISGSPGIGKSIFGLLLVPLFQQQDPPVSVVYQRWTSTMPFSNSSAPSILFENKQAIFGPKRIPPNAIYVIDSPQKSSAKPIQGHYCIVVTSPRADRLGSDLTKHSHLK